MLTVTRLRHCGSVGVWQNDGQEMPLAVCATGAVDAVATRPPFLLAPGQWRGLKEALGETTPFLLLLQHSSQAHEVLDG